MDKVEYASLLICVILEKLKEEEKVKLKSELLKGVESNSSVYIKQLLELIYNN